MAVMALLACFLSPLGYDGAAFSGFAEQPEGLRTVAGEVRRALETFLRRPVDLTCAGRTDAGVHAVSQYVSIPAHADEPVSYTHLVYHRDARCVPYRCARSRARHPLPGDVGPFPIRWRYLASGAMALLNLFSGGALSYVSVFSLGIMPYITTVSYTHLAR